jgi:DNA-binding MarR family transcriptional regulator
VTQQVSGPEAAFPAGGDPACPADEAALQLVLALHRLVRGLRRTAPAALPPTQLLVLAQLAQDGPLRIGELAARVPCSQPTATTVVSGLEAGGLVHRVPDRDDGRAIQVQLTEHGRVTIVSLAHEEAQLVARFLREVSPADRDAVLAAAPVLQRMAAALTGADED